MRDEGGGGGKRRVRKRRRVGREFRWRKVKDRCKAGW